MRAVLFEKPGGTKRLQLREVERPSPREGEVLLRVAYVGVNPLDRVTLSGTYPAHPMPHILGSEVAGTVEAVGPDTVGVAEGQEVAVYNRLFDGRCRFCLQGEEQLCVNGSIVGVGSQGGYAEFLRLPVENAIPLPEGLSLEGAAASALSAHTAWHMLFRRANLQPGEILLVLGASGGVGSFVVQMGRLVGARVFAVTRDVAKAGYLENQGADTVLEAAEDLTAWVRNATDGRGADLVVDPIGQATWAWSVDAVATNGRWATCGALTGREVTLNLGRLYQRQIRVVGSTGGSRGDLRAVLRAVAAGRLAPPVWHTYPLEAAAQAVEGLDEPGRTGKILMEIG